MRLKFFFVRFVNDIRLLIQHRQYTHRRLASLLAAVAALWFAYRIVHNILLQGYTQGNPMVDHWCDREDLPAYLTNPDPEEITVVTAFFNLGSYRSGPGAWDYTNPYQQKQWMRPWGRVANPVVAYIEDDEVAEYFQEIRSCLPEKKTKIIRVSREELWSFKLRPYFRRIYEKPGYPQHHPNTVFPAHTCASHAKYELLQTAVKKNYFQTPFFAWMDISYFRNLDQTNFKIFKLVPPTTFNTDLVSMTQAYPHDPNIPAKDVIEHNLVWVSGEMLLGVGETLLNFTTVYKQTVEQLLKDGLSSGDEQVIYLMYSTPMRRRKKVMVKTYMCIEGQLDLYGRDTRYLCLGYICRNTWGNIVKPGHR